MIRPFKQRGRKVRLSAVLFGMAGAGLLLWWRSPDWALLGQAFTNVRWHWILAALAFNILSVLARALCWWAILHQALAAGRLRYMNVLSGYSVGLMANAVLPGRVGEIARVVVLQRKLGSRRRHWPTLFGTVVAHRLLDLIPAVALVAWVIYAAPIPAWAYTSLITALAVGSLLFLAGIASARAHDGYHLLDKLGPLQRVIAFSRQGLAVFRSPRMGSLAAAFQILGWICQLLAVWTAMRAFHIDELPLVAAGLVLVMMNIAILFPLWPGNVGLLQAAVALPLVSYGIRYAHGFVFGIGLQVIEASVGIVFGLVFLGKEGISFAAIRETRDAVAGNESDRQSDQRPVADLETRIQIEHNI
ncbi:MAG: flippase-like domain-containing protein [Thermoleophilia bacterium]|nr:flippase-like domain-containing protein [Thermoleophilia bacterium]